MKRTTAAADGALRLFFLDFGTSMQMPYDDWEAAFVRRWNLRPTSSSRALEQLLHKRIDLQYVTLVDALRAFHQNEFIIPPERMHLLIAMERDFDKVPPDLAEPPLQPADWERVERQADDFNPKNPKRRGRTIFDMQGGVHRD